MTSAKNDNSVTNVLLIGSQEYLAQNLGSTLSRFITENKKRRILYVGHADHKVFSMSRLLQQKFSSQVVVIESFWKNGSPCPDWLYDASFTQLILCTTCQNALSWFSQENAEAKLSISDFDVVVLDDAVQLVDSNTPMSALFQLMNNKAASMPTFLAVSSWFDAKSEESDAIYKFSQIYRMLNIQKLLIATGTAASAPPPLPANAQLKQPQNVPVKLTDSERALQMEINTVIGIVKRTISERYNVMLDQISQDHLRHLIWFAKFAQLPTLEFYLQLLRGYQAVSQSVEALPAPLVTKALDAVFTQVAAQVKPIPQEEGDIIYTKTGKITSELDSLHFSSMKQYFSTEYNKWRPTLKNVSAQVNAKYEPLINSLRSTKAGELNLIIVPNDSVANFLSSELMQQKFSIIAWKQDEWSKYSDRSTRGSWQYAHTMICTRDNYMLAKFKSDDFEACFDTIIHYDASSRGFNRPLTSKHVYIYNEQLVEDAARAQEKLESILKEALKQTKKVLAAKEENKKRPRSSNDVLLEEPDAKKLREAPPIPAVAPISPVIVATSSPPAIQEETQPPALPKPVYVGSVPFGSLMQTNPSAPTPAPAMIPLSSTPVAPVPTIPPPQPAPNVISLGRLSQYQPPNNTYVQQEPAYHPAVTNFKHGLDMYLNMAYRTTSKVKIAPQGKKTKLTKISFTCKCNAILYTIETFVDTSVHKKKEVGVYIARKFFTTYLLDRQNERPDKKEQCTILWNTLYQMSQEPDPYTLELEYLPPKTSK